MAMFDTMYVVFRVPAHKSAVRLETWAASLGGHLSWTGDGLYRITFNEDAVRQIVAQRLRQMTGLEVLAFDAPYDQP